MKAEHSLCSALIVEQGRRHTKCSNQGVTWMDEYHWVLDSEPRYSRDLEILACHWVGCRIYKEIPNNISTRAHPKYSWR